MIFDELFFVELGLELKRRNQQKPQTGIAFRLDGRALSCDQERLHLFIDGRPGSWC